jgi:glycolate oxidase FAD binding subunit
MSPLVPTTEAEAADMVRAARSARTPLEIRGGGTRGGLGRPVQASSLLSTRALSGIVFHEPAELVIRARAGTPMAEIEAALDAHNQFLPFEPMDHRALYGAQGEPTIGAVAACNISGPRRIIGGAARDALIGVRFVNGMGEPIQSGGRVMKNVTGLDLVKLSAGAHGVLGLVTEVTFKLLPKPKEQRTLALRGLDDVTAIAALTAGLGSPFSVTGAAHVPGGVTGLRLEGFPESLDYRGARLIALLAPHGRAAWMEDDEAAAYWRDVRDARLLAAPRDAAVWRISAPPTRGPQIVARIAAARDARWLYDWGGGLIWLATPDAGDAGAEVVRAAARAAQGYATLTRASETTRNAVAVFEPPSDVEMKLTAGVKASFDPDRILNPGRMHAGV